MSIPQQLGTIGVIVLGTMLTRFLPFFIFPDNRPTPPFDGIWAVSYPQQFSACRWSIV